MKKHYKYIKRLLFAAFCAVSGAVGAIPALQLDIDGGTYDPVSETIITSQQSFNLFAYALPTGNLTADDIKGTSYYLAFALTGPDGGPVTTGGSFGSFTYSLDGGLTNITVAVTADMTFGTAPLETVLALTGFDSGDLSKHGIYETYFIEVALPSFTDAQTMEEYNTADFPGVPASPFLPGDMFYQTIAVDLTSLLGGYDIHFDLYSSAVVECKKNPNCTIGDVDVTDFAPFSHDAESTRDNIPPPPPPPAPVPEPETTWLLGLGLLGWAACQRRRVKLVA